ncbi:DUF1697 domain-containing protein [Isoptericola sp. NPDC057191]|uniref:DUF1697 domain-containing protein n=1 Tax=Isoptericola sp. NPDC057191 TaxID=3346041 RepID=UPI00363E30B0
MASSEPARTAYVVLLRGVNLGPHRRVSAADLRAAATDAGLDGARTYANSGNVVGTGDAGDEGVAERVAAALAERLGGDVRAVALPAGRAAALLAADPFPEAAADHPSQVLVLVGPEPVDADGVAALAEDHPERFVVAEGVLFVDYVDGIGKSRLTSAVIDRAAGTWTTGRNWNTLARLVAMAREAT